MSGADETKKIVVAPELPATSWPHLVILEGADTGRAYRLSLGETVIGREVGSSIRLPSGSVSRRHALVRMTADRLTIKDLGSRNGTFVGVIRIKGEVTLVDGDEITIGDTVLLQLSYSVALEAALQRAGYYTASRDSLTDLSGVPHFLDRLRAEYAFARRHRTPLAVGYFRASRGAHVAAVRAIGDMFKALANALHQSTRAEDLIARTGENEIMVLLRADAREAEQMAGRICAALTFDDGEAPRPRAALDVVVVPLTARAVTSPDALVVAVRAEARRAIGGGTDCMLVVPPLDVPGGKEDGA